jgi:dihydrofolate reductase
MQSIEIEKRIIAAMTRRRVIGAGGDLPWDLSGELRLFRELTWGHSVVMGRRTFESIGRPLPGRRNIVLSRSLSSQPGVIVCRSLGEGLKAAADGHDRVFFIGGAEVYAQALPLADVLHVSWIRRDYPGDARFPLFTGRDWRVVRVDDRGEFRHVVYRRRRTRAPGEIRSRRDAWPGFRSG